MAHSDLNELLKPLLGIAESLLTKQGAFLPIGVMMLSNREIRHVGALIEGNDQPGAAPLIAMLTGTFQKVAKEGKLLAVGMAYDVLIVPPGKHQKQDAICCSLEHYLGEAVNVFKPYVRTEEGHFQFEEIFATKGTQKFFGQLPRG